MQLLWTVNSGFIGVTRTSTCSYNSSGAASQAKCMFWLLSALKDDLFPERIWNVLFVIRKWCLNSYGKYLGIRDRSAQNNTTLETAHTISLISPSKSSSLVRATVIKLVLRVEWNETVRTRCDPFDSKKFSNLSPEILVEWIAPTHSHWLKREFRDITDVLIYRDIPDWSRKKSSFVYGYFYFACHGSFTHSNNVHTTI